MFPDDAIDRRQCLVVSDNEWNATRFLACFLSECSLPRYIRSSLYLVINHRLVVTSFCENILNVFAVGEIIGEFGTDSFNSECLSEGNALFGGWEVC